MLPHPVSPLGATLSWIPGVLEGWRDGNVRQGAFSREELDGEVNPCCAVFNGYLYVNASVVRVYGERAGAGAAAIDAAFFGNRPDTPPYVPHPDDQSPEAAERIGATMGWVMSAVEWPEMMESKALADAARAERGDLTALLRRGAGGSGTRADVPPAPPVQRPRAVVVQHRGRTDHPRPGRAGAHAAADRLRR